MTEKERAREEYLKLREEALKFDRKERLSKVWMDTHYLLCGGLLIAAIAYFFINKDAVSFGTIAVWVAVIVAFIAFGAVPTSKMNKNKKQVHDLRQKLDDLESKYHL